MTPSGRRERTTRERRERILAAAGELFDERGYDAVTTAEIAERADISHATLFRYAATKSELLLLAGNAWFRDALDEGARRARDRSSVRDRLWALLSPLVDDPTGLTRVATYQRHAVAGSAASPHASTARELVAELVARIADILREDTPAPPAAEPDPALAAAHAVYATVHLAILEADLEGTDLLPLLTPQLDIVIRGHHAAATEERREE
ncbi:TetR/AcrR family transcriptional regulator [Microbacterium sp. SORGH_AS_0888]|uniref:TetR/AcrR family transcriptional regulator n=1 Tax=Microbacterium sp. SORGH_AS_0888 TaxID=3041791 RepID=UPI0027844997|nr:TetR/AcrR family transcriptional regulator [Microbacterium sp. SORGH_AS_0888]MDQ1129185.1 AcrR family transcriptional regulator [Microbacterium sp. SORGH_AS_0888]